MREEKEVRREWGGGLDEKRKSECPSTSQSVCYVRVTLSSVCVWISPMTYLAAPV